MGMHSSDLSIITPCAAKTFLNVRHKPGSVFSGIQLHGQRPVALTAGNPLLHPGLSLPMEEDLKWKALF